MTREENFFNALRDVFVNAKVEGKSGYINLIATILIKPAALGGVACNSRRSSSRATIVSMPYSPDEMRGCGSHRGTGESTPPDLQT